MTERPGAEGVWAGWTIASVVMVKSGWTIAGRQGGGDMIKDIPGPATLTLDTARDAVSKTAGFSLGILF